MFSNKDNYIQRFFYFLVIVFNFQMIVYAQSDEAQRIQNIIIIGNETTKDNVILRELVIHKGDIPTQSKLQESQQRLMNLLLFNRVQMNVYPQDEKSLVLIIEVTERLYFYPVPILTIQERDWTKWSYGLSLVNSNFRGQNEKLWAGAWFGFRPGFGLRYTDPWAGDSLHLNTGFSMQKTNFNHRNIEGMEERHLIGRIAVGKWWNRIFNTSMTFHFDRIKVAEDFRDLMRSGNTTEYTVGLELAFRYDTRDLYFYPSTGWFNVIRFFKYGIFQNYNNYENIAFDMRKYFSVGPLIFAGRFFQNSLFGEIPIYRLNYIGFEERIRGYFNQVWTGTHVQMGSLEARFPIIPIRYISLDLPIIPAQYLQNLKLGLSGALFVDTGIVWDSADEYTIDNFTTGFGFGFHFHLPYVEVFRFDVGFNRELNSQLIFEVGVVF
jgi:outer membrane protein insertion porin family